MKNILKHGDFVASIHFGSNTELLFGKVEGVDDYLTFEGSSVDELKIAITEAIENYIDICSKIGKTLIGHTRVVSISVLSQNFIKKLLLGLLS